MSRDLLKFITCGSVDDGKSTLIGHLIYESNLIYIDQAKAIEQVKVGDLIDYSLLLDGLMDERAQGITIDVAYRYFDTKERSFILADTPGHEQYTRNMAVGAAFADLAIVLIDATKGVLTQTRRHLFITNMMGIKHYVVAINKMDLVNYSEVVFEQIKIDINELFSKINVHSLIYIPVSATKGDNVNRHSSNMPFYLDLPILDYLNSVNVDNDSYKSYERLVFPIQRVQRGVNGFRYYQGEIVSGSIEVGQQIIAMPSKLMAYVESIFVGNKKVEKATANQPVSIRFDKEIDLVRGDVVVTKEIKVASNFNARVLWTSDDELNKNKDYIIRVHTKQTLATIKEWDLVHLTSSDPIISSVTNNTIIDASIHSLIPIPLDTFENSSALGGFILINPVSNLTVAVGTINAIIENQHNLYKFDFTLGRENREKLKGQKAKTIWVTGLSGSGKSYFSNRLETKLIENGYHTMLLDGDNIRNTISDDLGFSASDRTKNVVRTAKTAKLMNDAGLIVIVALISPLISDRNEAREIIGHNDFIEVFMNTPLEMCIDRDSKGLYKKAISGQISNFTGISSTYETPIDPQVTIIPSDSLEEKVDEILTILHL